MSLFFLFIKWERQNRKKNEQVQWCPRCRYILVNCRPRLGPVLGSAIERPPYESSAKWLVKNHASIEWIQHWIDYAWSPKRFKGWKALFIVEDTAHTLACVCFLPRWKRMTIIWINWEFTEPYSAKEKSRSKNKVCWKPADFMRQISEEARWWSRRRPIGMAIKERETRLWTQIWPNPWQSKFARKKEIDFAQYLHCQCALSAILLACDCRRNSQTAQQVAHLYSLQPHR